MESVLILGGTSDIGFSLANIYAKEGYNIILAGRNKEQLNRNRSDIEIKFDVQVEVVPFDGYALNDHENFCAQLPFLPGLTICVFGYLGDQDNAFEQTNEALQIIQSNYTGSVTILNAIAQQYIKNKKGGIIAVSSVAGDRGRQSNFIYGSAKAGFTAYLQGLRNRLYSENIHVLTVKPGFVKTKMTEKLDLPRPLTASPEEVAEKIFKAYRKKKNVIYVKWVWRYIMVVITLIPEAIFKKLKL